MHAEREAAGATAAADFDDLVGCALDEEEDGEDDDDLGDEGAVG